MSLYIYLSCINQLILIQSLRFHDRIHSNVNEAVLLISDAIAGSYMDGMSKVHKAALSHLLMLQQMLGTEQMRLTLGL